MKKKKAESKLKDEKQNCHLLRYSQNKKIYILSVGWEGKIRHFKVIITTCNTKNYEIDGSRSPFTDYRELFQFYQMHPLDDVIGGIGYAIAAIQDENKAPHRKSFTKRLSSLMSPRKQQSLVNKQHTSQDASHSQSPKSDPSYQEMQRGCYPHTTSTHAESNSRTSKDPQCEVQQFSTLYDHLPQNSCEPDYDHLFDSSDYDYIPATVKPDAGTVYPDRFKHQDSLQASPVRRPRYLSIKISLEESKSRAVKSH